MAHDLCDTGFHPSTVATGTSPAIVTGTQTRLFNKRIILWAPENCCRNVTAVRYGRRAQRAERVGRSFIGIGVRTESRRSRTFSPDAREGYRWSSGGFSSTDQPTSLYIDPSPPPLVIRVYPRHFCSHPPQNSPNQPPSPQKSETLAPGPPGAVRSEIRRSGCTHVVPQHSPADPGPAGPESAAVGPPRHIWRPLPCRSPSSRARAPRRRRMSSGRRRAPRRPPPRRGEPSHV